MTGFTILDPMKITKYCTKNPYDPDKAVTYRDLILCRLTHCQLPYIMA